MQIGSCTHLPNEFLMLGHVSIRVPSQECTWLLRTRGDVADRVELVVAHDGMGIPGVDHGAHQIHHLNLIRPAVDQVAQEDRLSSRRGDPPARAPCISHPAQEGFELAGLPVDVADHVVAHAIPRDS